MKRTLITLLAVLIGVGFLWGLVSNTTTTDTEEPAAPQQVAQDDQSDADTPTERDTADDKATDPDPDTEADGPGESADAGDQAEEPSGEQPSESDAAESDEADPAEAMPPAEDLLMKLPLKAIGATEPEREPVLGSADLDADENPYMLEAKFSPWGSGIKQILLSRYTEEPRSDEPYKIQYRQDLIPFAARSIQLKRPGGEYQRVSLVATRFRLEEQTGAAGDAQSVTFVADVVNADGEKLVTLRRKFTLRPGRYDITMHQTVTNHTGGELVVYLEQFGPADMPFKPTYLGDRRAYHVGYFQPQWDPDRLHVSTQEGGRGDLSERADPLWVPESGEKEREMAWVALTNRYFATVAFNPVGEVPEEGRPAVEPLETTFPRVRAQSAQTGNELHPFIVLDAAPLKLSAGETGSRDLGIYAGPKAPDVIDTDPVYDALGFHQLIIYNIGGMCTFCTFAWLAEGLLWFLKLIHGLVLDWGVAIVILVAVVRTLLHPITKRSQLNMMKFGKQMAALQPEMERLKKKYGDNQQKLNQEMMRLYQERGVNPAAMSMGCLPMFLQMPIWIALYAMLFFAIELRHESAFYGVFQAISGGHWQFLGDLSAPDNFINFGAGFDIPFIGWHIDSLNLLPVLMIGIFFLQQKYNTAPTAGQSDQAKQQQRIMRVMMMLFPIFLYAAPSGLNLYILASTSVGIIESRRVRAHIQAEEEAGNLDFSAKAKPKKKKDDSGRKRVQSKSRKK